MAPCVNRPGLSHFGPMRLLFNLLPLLLVSAAAEEGGDDAALLPACDSAAYGREPWASESPPQIDDGRCVVVGTSSELLAALHNATVEEVWVTDRVSVAGFPDGVVVTISRPVLLRGVSDDAAIVGFEQLSAGSLVVSGVWLAMEELLVSGLWAVDVYAPYLGETNGLQCEGDFGDEGGAARVPPSPWARQLATVPDGPGSAAPRRAGVLLRRCVFEVPQTPVLATVPESWFYNDFSLPGIMKYGDYMWGPDGFDFNADVGMNWPAPSLSLNNDQSALYMLENAFDYLRMMDTHFRAEAELARRMLVPGVPAELMAEERLEAEARSDCQTYTGWEYTGDVSTSLSGRACLPWSDFDIEHLDTSNFPGNRCRCVPYQRLPGCAGRGWGVRSGYSLLACTQLAIAPREFI
mmetsp:Transcript_11895/g.30100  ORF Transcript_11895/g.30100 Transcript_11895/m.30100 type:complete len:408 (-) Transcript_11895:247-1470(-)